MLRIGFDHRIFFYQKYGGISRYFVQLAKRLMSSTNDVDLRVIAPLFRNEYLGELSRSRVIGLKWPYIAHNRPDGTVRYNSIFSGMNDRFAMGVFKIWKPNLVHETYYSRRPVVHHSCPSVVTVYDMITERCPEEFDFSSSVTADKKATLERASHIVCISENTRDELIDIFGVDRDKTTVIYLGVDQEPQLSSSVDSRGASKKNFLLYVGNRGGYKNFLALLEAYGTSKMLREEFDLIAFGGGPFTSAEDQLAQNLNISPDRLRHVGGDDTVLADLYRRAALLVFPSLHEGFGLPLIEAMAYRCPVVCSKTSVMPEICGSGAEYFDPKDVSSIRKSIERVLCSPERVFELTSIGQRRAYQFSWERCANQTLSLYRQIVGDL
jgi:glycosyltransferase involved in cell wall biosynthesis